MEQKCPYCGAALPEQASFCPHCARSVNRRTPARAPAPFPWRKLLRVALPLLVMASLLLGWFLATRPRTYDDGGAATVTYSDGEGRYQLLLGQNGNRFLPTPEVTQIAEEGGEYRFPVCLYVNQAENDANAANTFLQKVDHVTAQFEPLEGEEGAAAYTPPAPNDYIPEAALVSYVDFSGREALALGTWTIAMKNGDLIRLHQTLKIQLIQTLDYYPEEYPMATAQELQALIDRIGETADPSSVVNLHLPAVTYAGDVTVEKHAVNLLGSTEGEGRTAFTGTLRLATGANQWINEVRDVDFVGSGRENMAVTAAARVHLTGCTFTGWRTAVLAHGRSWVNLRQCSFTDNEIAFHFNATESRMSHSVFDGNCFSENGTAILWEGTDAGSSISFPDTVFAHNGTDVDNRSGQTIDLSQAIFQ